MTLDGTNGQKRKVKDDAMNGLFNWHPNEDL